MIERKASTGLLGATGGIRVPSPTSPPSKIPSEVLAKLRGQLGTKAPTKPTKK